MKRLWQRLYGWYMYTAAGLLIDTVVAYTVLAGGLWLLCWLAATIGSAV